MKCSDCEKLTRCAERNGRERDKLNVKEIKTTT